MIRLYNTLTRKKEEFQTLEPGIVKMYVCGVTVYNDAHVGHAMSALVFDIIRRYLEYRGYKVNHVMNYTDVDDKIINRANQMGVDPFALAEGYIKDYHQNLLDLNVLPATINPRATQEIDNIVGMIRDLGEKDFAYEVDGDVYFRVAKDSDYGKLSGRKFEDMQSGSRIDVDGRKESPMDFALWKAAKPGEPAWDSPWGKGRPGWHIECSAMNLHHLGEQIDIHGGGNDLIFPHHENEIAQTESLTGKPFARYWIHNGMLQLGGEKMSKSLGNIISIKEFLAKRDGDVMRMLVLNGSYRAPLMFNDETLDAAEKGLERIKAALKPASTKSSSASVETLSALAAQVESTRTEFTSAMDDDFNTAGALGVLFDLVRAVNTARDLGADDAQLKPAQETLRELTGILGLKLEARKAKSSGIEESWILEKIEQRNQARRNKDWAASDKIRDELLAQGIKLEDGKEGTTWQWS
jgi:cysteinyl-tRNA synthetase